jgi:hypothetical protein
MKLVLLLLGIGLLVSAGGCADPLEKRSTGEVEGQLERGVRGQGTIGPVERSEGDPANEHSVPQTHP